MIELLMTRWHFPSPLSEGKVIINDLEGDGGIACRQFPPIQANTTVTTVMTIDSISSGRVRFDIAGERGAWRSTAGTYTEEITASNGDYISIIFDTFTVATLDLGTLSVGVPEE